MTLLNTAVIFLSLITSWEREQNENANVLPRQYFPKSMKLIDIAISNVKIAVDKLNSSPRKCLGFKTTWPGFFRDDGR